MSNTIAILGGGVAGLSAGLGDLPGEHGFRFFSRSTAFCRRRVSTGLRFKLGGHSLMRL